MHGLAWTHPTHPPASGRKKPSAQARRLKPETGRKQTTVLGLANAEFVRWAGLILKHSETSTSRPTHAQIISQIALWYVILRIFRNSPPLRIRLNILVMSGSLVFIGFNFPPKLRRARSRLYRRRFLQVNTRWNKRWKALAEIYTMHSFAPFSNLNFFVKNRQFFLRLN